MTQKREARREGDAPKKRTSAEIIGDTLPF
jgi:hypothetical protein